MKWNENKNDNDGLFHWKNVKIELCQHTLKTTLELFSPEINEWKLNIKTQQHQQSVPMDENINFIAHS